MIKKILLLSSLSAMLGSSAVAQLMVDLNTITTAVPFLIINPETRGGGMGDVGVATSADANSMHWNPAKYAFAEDRVGLGISYTPWLRALVPDISLAYLAGFKKLDNYSAVSGALRYFSLGDIQFTDQFGNNTIQHRPNEFTLDLGYSRRLAPRLSAGLAARYIHSNLTGGIDVQGAQSRPGRSVAVDLSVYYENDDIELFEKDATFAWGLNVSNLGAKISYTNTARRDFLPMNLRLGPRVTVDLDEYNSLTLAMDINKYLVPTPPVYAEDTNGSRMRDENGEFIIAAGADPNRGVVSGALGSFTDAPGRVIGRNDDGTVEIEPGSVLGEELREINFGIGAEYWYDKQFALRAGYFWEHLSKGNRKFITVGAGFKLNVFALDFSYLVPAYFSSAQIVQNSPLQRTLRFTLSFNFAQPLDAGNSDPAGS